MDKTAGILFAISSLPSKYGIGCFSKEAYKFVDWLVEAGQTFWQILPLGPTGYGDSPYQSFSTFAGNPYFIDLETLISEGLLTREECDSVDFGTDEQSVDYEKQYNGRYVLLRKACERSGHKNSTEYKAFLDKNEAWVYDYCLYMAVKNHFGGMNWTEWPEAIHSRTEEGLREYKEKLADEIDFQLFMQFQFFNQWYKLRAYANKKGIKIIGDIPIYVSLDSADAWSHPELFQLDEQCTPKAIAGCPPDGFSADGQLWGNPLYDWDYHKKTHYDWWMRRIKGQLNMVDYIRVDHFRGFDSYYAIPAKDKTAKNGKWKQGPGMDLFNQLEKKLGKLPIIVEDLGFLTDSVRKLLKDSGFPGMKVIQFAFDSREGSDYLPHTYTSHCVVYTGTHDNATCNEDYHTYDSNKRISLRRFFKNQGYSSRAFNEMLCQFALDSNADTVILPIWDICGYKEEARINTPGTVSNKNWTWKLKDFKTFPDKVMKTKEWIEKSNR